MSLFVLHQQTIVCWCKNIINTFSLVFFIFINVNSQYNLVPNSSFEFFSECPNMSLNYCSINVVEQWQGTITNSTDYFNSCATTFICNVPFISSSIQFQYAENGVGFAGLWISNGYSVNYREYLQVQLNESLISNKFYFIKFYTNNSNGTFYACNNIGVYFSAININPNNEDSVIHVNPQILKYRNPIISDTLNWVEISGIYQAQGGEEYITIGNFKYDSETDTLNTGNGTYPGAYYYIDDVSVIPIDSIPGGLPAFAGIDTTIFEGQSVFLGQEITNLNCSWYVLGSSLPVLLNDSGIDVSPTENTTYIVEQNLAGIISYDTVTVTVINLVPTISANDTLRFCEGDSVLLSSDVGTNLLWSNGATSQSITVTEAGTYFVTRYINAQSLVSNALVVEVIPSANASLSTLSPFCDTSSVYVFSNGLPNGGIYYLNGIESTFFDPQNNDLGDYELKYVVYNENCVDSISIVFSLVSCSVGLSSPSADGEGLRRVKIAPNPNSGTFTIELNTPLAIQELNILDALGRNVRKLDTKNSKIDVTLSSGIYFLEIISENSRVLEKIVVN
jgi:hypothetical protein